jgi:hypothetical protein
MCNTLKDQERPERSFRAEVRTIQPTAKAKRIGNTGTGGKTGGWVGYREARVLDAARVRRTRMNMKGKVAWWLAALLLVGLFAGAEPPWYDATPAAERQEAREVGGQVDSGRVYLTKIKKLDLTIHDPTILCPFRSDISISNFRDKDAKRGNEQ